MDARRINGVEFTNCIGIRTEAALFVSRMQKQVRRQRPIVTYSEFRTAQSRFESAIRIAEREAEQIRENQPAGVKSAGKEEKSDETETGTRSIRQSEIHRVESGASESFGGGDHRDRAKASGRRQRCSGR